MNSFHTPVLLKEVVEYLKIEKGKKYIDATVGGGGQTVEILKRGGIVLGIDCDQEAIDCVKQDLSNVILSEAKDLGSSQASPDQNDRKCVTLVKGNFRDIDKIAHLNNFDKVAGIIFDLGVSSHQLEVPGRGFSFQKEGPLDMRMDKDLAVQAKDLLQVLTKGELYELFSKLGEESNARRISEYIVSARKVKPIETTQDLALIIERAYGMKRGATSANARASADKKVFQALRIAVNDELNALRETLPKGVKLLEENGRLLVISFHSLEDRIVKQSFIEFQERRIGKIITKKPISPCIEEINKNKRSRSAKLRVFKKI